MDLRVSALYVGQAARVAKITLALGLLSWAAACSDSAPVEPVGPRPEPIIWSTPVQLGSEVGLVPVQLIAAGTELFLLAERHVGTPVTQLLLQTKTDGSWSAPELVAEGEPSLFGKSFARDGSGDLHFIWLAAHTASDSQNPAYDAFVRYRSRSGAAWSPPETMHEVVGRSYFAPIAHVAAGTDAEGRAHIVFEEIGSGFSWFFAHNGSRSQRARLETPFLGQPTFSVGGTTGLSLILAGNSFDGPSGFAFRAFVATMHFRDGSWEAPSMAHTGGINVAAPARMAVEQGGRRHLVWGLSGGASQLFHSVSIDGVNWALSAEIARASPQGIQLAIDRHDRLHLMFAAAPMPFHYRRFQNGSWSIAPSPGSMVSGALAFDGDSRLHAVWLQAGDGRLYHASLDVGL